jgi:hypothetical protein
MELTITILDIIHRHVVYLKRNVSVFGWNLLRWAQQIELVSLHRLRYLRSLQSLLYSQKKLHRIPSLLIIIHFTPVFLRSILIYHPPMYDQVGTSTGLYISGDLMIPITESVHFDSGVLPCFMI